jgi:hypothetical protein
VQPLRLCLRRALSCTLACGARRAAKTEYHTSLANVDWLHGSAESLLTITNIFIVLGLRGALRGDTAAAPPASREDSR